MNAKEFFDKVVKMREAQKRYFKTRSSLDLQLSKRLEKEIDNEIARVAGVRKNGTNNDLFKQKS